MFRFRKTYLTTLIISRSVLEGVKHCIIDPENEYGPCVEVYKGITVRISPNSTSRMNPFDIDEEIITDDYGNDTGKRFVDIKGKVAELLNLFAVMIPEYMKDAEIKSEISTVCSKCIMISALRKIRRAYTKTTRGLIRKQENT